MAAYLVLGFEVTDLNTFMGYVEKIPKFIEKHSGKYIVEGTMSETIEGDWRPDRLVILEFPDTDKARAFVDDPEVQPIFALRHSSTKGDLILAEGGSWRDAPQRD